MNGYGRAAAVAAKDCQCNPARDPVDAWADAVAKEFTSAESRKKSCPRGAFLGLCEAKLVSGVIVKGDIGSRLNKAYAIAAVAELRKNPGLADNNSFSDLWRCVSPKKHNQQMDVVVALWRDGFIAKV